MSNTEPSEPTRPTPIYVDADDEDPEFVPRPRRRAHRFTYVLGGLALAAIGFYAGVLTQKHEDHNGSSASAASALSAFTGRRGGTGGSGAAAGGVGGAGTANAAGNGFGRFGGGTAGPVKFVDGSNVYITDANGNVVKVLTNGASTISKTDPATTKDVAPGQTVIVRGTQNSDGSYTATSVTVTPAGAGGGAGFAGLFGGRGSGRAGG